MHSLPRFLCFLFFIYVNELKSQQLSCTNITPDDGLPSSEVYYCLQDHKGYMWFATDAGVCRYNGCDFRTFTSSDGLPGNTVFHLCEDADGRMWCDAMGSISYIKDDKVYSIPANDTLFHLLQKGQILIRKIFIDHEGTLWICSGSGFIWIKKEDGYTKCYQFNKDEDSTRLYGKLIDSTWLFVDMMSGMRNSNTIHTTLDYGTKKIFFLTSYNEFLRVTSVSMCGVMTKSGDLVCNVYTKLLYITGTDHKEVATFKDTPICIYYGDDRLVWVCVLMDGVYCYKDNDFSKPLAHYFPGISVSSICTDREGGLWFTTLEKGVMYCPSRAITDYRNLPLMNQRVCALGHVQNGLLIGTYGNGILNYNEKADSFSQVFPNPFPMTLNDVHQTSDGVLVAGSFHVGVINKGLDKLIPYYECLPDPNTGMVFPSGGYKVTETKEGRRLVLTSIYLRELCDTAIIADHSSKVKTYHYQTRMIALPSRGRELYCTRENEILVGCMDGLYQYENYQFTTLGKKDSLFYSEPFGIKEDKNGVIWIITKGNGIVIWNRKKTIHLTIENGLPTNSCRAIDFDEDGNAWIGTTKGLVKVIVNYGVYERSRIESYNTANGIISDEIMKICILNDKVWLGTNKGVCTVDIKKLKPNSYAPPVFISGIQVDDKRYSSFDTLPAWRYDQHNFRFFLDALSYRGDVDFLYHLEGFDEKWESTGQHEIVYRNLPPGSYKLVVYARNNDKVRSDAPAIFNFKIPSPFWKTGWFFALEIIIVAGIVVFFVRLRLRKIRAQEEEKTHVNKLLAEFQLTALRAQMNPHFIFNAINSIQSFVLLNNSQEAYNYLAKFSRLIRMVLNNAQERLILLEQELSMLNLYVELEQLRFSSKFAYKLRLDPAIDDSQVLIPPMMFQPYVENAICMD
ncbi:MAG: two-component regulator propeller domain-containing protein [Bacteroidia bacterium]